MQNQRAIESAKTELQKNIEKLTMNISTLRKKISAIGRIKAKWDKSSPLSPHTAKQLEEWMARSPGQAMTTMDAISAPRDDAIKVLIATLNRNIRFETTIRESLRGMLTALESS